MCVCVWIVPFLNLFEECNVQLARHLGLPQPLYLRPDNGQFMLPQTSAGVIQLPKNSVINVYCPAGFKGKLQSSQEKTIAATCISGIQFNAVNAIIEFNEFVCTRPPRHKAKRTLQKCPGGQIAEIGFDTESKFLR